MARRRGIAPALAALALPFACSFGSRALAGDSILDGIRQLDLNNYALGMNVYQSTSPYDGIEDFVVVFPAPTQFEPAFVTDETFFIRDGDFGLRTRLGEHWDIGGILAILSLGYGSGQSEALAGMSRRDWTIHGGVTIGRNLGDYRFDFGARTDLLGEHGGQELEFKLARIFARGSHYFLPQVDAKWQSSKLVNHYFGVTAAEALPDRPAYRPGATVTYGGSLEWGWKWHPNWYVSASASVEWLPTEIRNSPIVDRDSIGSVMLTLGYDAPSMVTAAPSRADVYGSGVEITAGAFFVSADSKIFLTDGNGDAPIDLESEFTVGDTDVGVPISLRWRISPFHSLEFGYFELNRSGAGDIVVPVDVGAASFSQGEAVNTGFDTRIFRLGYAFSLLHDTQKELAIFGGAHVSDVSFRSRSANDDVTADTTAILPVLGASLVINFTDRLSLGTALQFFVSDVNRYSGNLIDFGLSGQYSWGRRFSFGIGYRYYRQDIDTADEDFKGDYRFEYRGPVVFISARL